MKKYEIDLSIKFELPAPNPSVVINDVSEMVTRLGVDKKSVSVYVREIDPMESITSITIPAAQKND